MKETVILGMSGGIDSSVAAYLLKEEGYRVIGVQMKYWSEQGSCTFEPSTGKITASSVPNNRFRNVMENKCCSDDSILLARAVAQHLDIPFYVHAIDEQFKENIVDYYLQEVEQGRTPNPCTRCNKLIKFGELSHFGQTIGCTKTATGHYAQITHNPNTGIAELSLAQDIQKDQTYFLYELSQAQLQQSLFPLGHLIKSEVFTIAEQVGLTAYKKNYEESQGLCFFQEKTPEAFLERHIQNERVRSEGNMCTMDGKIIGKHKGLMYYTIGQRRGINIGGLREPYFVIAKDHEKNMLYVGPKEDLYQKRLMLKQMNLQQHCTFPLRAQARIRYRMPLTPCTISTTDQSNEYLVTFDEPVYAITPGQALVAYDDKLVLGGGIISHLIIS